MVRMVVGEDHAPHLLHLGEELLPQGARFRIADARIDDGPRAVVLLEEPQVDVVELERQRHAEPLHAWRDLGARAGHGHVAERVFEQSGSAKMKNLSWGWTKRSAESSPSGSCRANSTSRRAPSASTRTRGCSRRDATGNAASTLRATAPGSSSRCEASVSAFRSRRSASSSTCTSP